MPRAGASPGLQSLGHRPAAHKTTTAAGVPRTTTPPRLKLIWRELQGTAAATRLLREARAAAKVRHPSIVQVFDGGTAEAGDPFIGMDLLEGRMLRDLPGEVGVGIATLVSPPRPAPRARSR